MCTDFQTFQVHLILDYNVPLMCVISFETTPNLNKQYYKLHVQKVTSVYIAHFCLVNNFTLVFFSWVCLFIFLLHHVYMNLFCISYMHCNIQWCIFSCQIGVKNSSYLFTFGKGQNLDRTYICSVWRTYILVIYETGKKL